MRLTIIAASLLAAGLLAGHAEAGDGNAKAELKNAEGRTIGEAKLEQTKDGVRIKADLTGLPPGAHAFHIHEVGKCEAPFESAGGHFNPTQKQHGKDNPQGMHAGDLPNIQVTDGRPVKIDVVARGLSLDGGSQSVFDADGSALVIHAAADDYKSDPAGNAGDRIACGVIKQ
jgi:Cu-Zn family superoxide dismutase